MKYIYLFSVSILYTVQTIFSKLYQKNTAGILKTNLIMTILMSMYTIIMFFSLNQFRVTITGASAFLAVLYSIISLISIISFLAAIGSGSLAGAVLYSLSGAIVVPFLVGITVFGEKISAGKLYGMIIILLSLFSYIYDIAREKRIRVNKSESPKKLFYAAMCVAVFISNGVSGPILTAHQKLDVAIAPERDFLIFSNLSQLVISLCIFLILNYADTRVTKNRFIKEAAEGMGTRPMPFTFLPDIKPMRLLYVAVLCLLFSVINSFANFFSLIVAKSFDSSFQFPIISAVCIAGGLLISKFVFHEIVSKTKIVTVILCIVGILFFII